MSDAVAGIAEPVLGSRRHHDRVPGACLEMPASKAELHAAFEHREALFLTRMDVPGGNMCARGKIEIELENLSAGVASVPADHDALAAERVRDHGSVRFDHRIELCRHLGAALPRMSTTRLSATTPSTVRWYTKLSSVVPPRVA